MKTLSITGAFLVVILAIALATGWVKCLYNLTQCDFRSDYKCEVINGTSLVTGLGAVTGYFNIRDEEK